VKQKNTSHEVNIKKYPTRNGKVLRLTPEMKKKIKKNEAKPKTGDADSKSEK